MRHVRQSTVMCRAGLFVGLAALLGGLAAPVEPAAGAAARRADATDRPLGAADRTADATDRPLGAAIRPARVPGDPLTGSGVVDRTQLTAADLTGGTAASTVPDGAFALPAAAARPRHTFSGRLELVGEETGGGFTTLRDDYGITQATAFAGRLPEFSQEFVQNGSHLVPVVQGLQYTGNEMWNLVVGPGRVWSERGDGGRSRAAVPFALVQRINNCTHNGTLTFLFTDETVSHVRYQITQETCLYYKVDMWGQLAARYSRYQVRRAAALRGAHAAEVAHRLPTKPIAALASDHPEAKLDLTAFGNGITPAHLTMYGLLYQGTNYVSGCTTRQGTYPFCEVMRVPSYSVAKSAFASTALMRLARTRGPGVAREPISRWVPESASAAGDWSEVSIGDALDMATGNFESTGYLTDEHGPIVTAFGLAEPHAEKIALAFSFPHRAPPGTQWVYHTSDTYVAARAMQNLLGADLFDMVRDEVYVPAGLSLGALTSMRSDNSPTGMAQGGYGLFLTSDDVAKLATLYHHGGAIGGRQILDPRLLAATLQRDPADGGLPTTDSAGDFYRNGFWARPLTPTDVPGQPCSLRVPFMSGYGGIDVVLLPNGATYYYFSDNDEFSWLPALREAGKLAPYCR